MLKHLLIASESQDEYIRSYLGNGDNANFLKIAPDSKFQMQLRYFDAELAEIAELARNAGVPLIAVFVPNRPQAAMLSKGDWPAGYDPFKLEDEVRDNVVNHGGRFIDIFDDFRRIPGPERDYFPVDGHPNADGHAIISKFLAKELTSGPVPELKGSTSPRHRKRAMNAIMDTASLQFVLFGLITAVLSNLGHSRVWRSIVIMLASLNLSGNASEECHSVDSIGDISALRLWRSCRAGARPVKGGALVHSRSDFRLRVVEEVYVLAGADFPALSLFHSWPFIHIFPHPAPVDRSRGRNRVEQKRRVGFGAYLLYTLNFTTFISGPIQRYDEFARDQYAVQPLTLEPRVIGLQLERIIRGFFKVNVLAMLLHRMQENGLEQLTQPVSIEHKLLAAIQLTVVYPLFLYANFSGYIDIVIALARLMRVRLPENFDRPFSASSFLDFWNRWHITLSTWLKTYVYNPLLLALMRRISSLVWQPFLGVFCFFVTFFLIGVWHGRTSEYIVFGVLQGGGVAINKLWQLWLTGVLGRKAYKERAKNAIYIAFGRGLTFSWFAFSMFWFWANWQQIGTVFSAIAVGPWLAVWLVIWFWSHRRFGNVGADCVSIAKHRNVGRAGAYQSLCPGSIRNCYGGDCSRYHRSAQSACSGNRIQGILARGEFGSMFSPQRHRISVSKYD